MHACWNNYTVEVNKIIPDLHSIETLHRLVHVLKSLFVFRRRQTDPSRDLLSTDR